MAPPRPIRDTQNNNRSSIKEAQNPVEPQPSEATKSTQSRPSRSPSRPQESFALRRRAIASRRLSSKVDRTRSSAEHPDRSIRFQLGDRPSSFRYRNLRKMIIRHTWNNQCIRGGSDEGNRSNQARGLREDARLSLGRPRAQRHQDHGYAGQGSTCRLVPQSEDRLPQRYRPAEQLAPAHHARARAESRDAQRLHQDVPR